MTGRNGLLRGSFVFFPFLKRDMKKGENSLRKHLFPGRVAVDEGTVETMGKGRGMPGTMESSEAGTGNQAYVTDEGPDPLNLERNFPLPGAIPFSVNKMRQMASRGMDGGNTVKTRQFSAPPAGWK